MGAVIQFPKDRIVRQLKKRVARPRTKTATPLETWQVEARKLAIMGIDHALKAGRSLEQLAEHLRCEQPSGCDQTPAFLREALVYTHEVMVKEVTTRLAEERQQEVQQQSEIHRLVKILESKAADPNDPFAKRLKYLRERKAAQEHEARQEERRERMAELLAQRSGRSKAQARIALDKAIQEVKE